MIERISVKVGLQLVNTGQSAKPINTYLRAHFFLFAWARSLFELLEKPTSAVIFFQIFGKTVIIPSPIISPPEKLFQKLGGTSISSVEVLRSKVKTIIDSPSEVIMIIGVYLFFPSSSEAQKIIGRIGSTQGASTVKIPEKNATMSNMRNSINSILSI